jgi:hypothetical protein
LKFENQNLKSKNLKYDKKKIKLTQATCIIMTSFWLWTLTKLFRFIILKINNIQEDFGIVNWMHIVKHPLVIYLCSIWSMALSRSRSSHNFSYHITNKIKIHLILFFAWILVWIFFLSNHVLTTNGVSSNANLNKILKYELGYHEFTCIK